MTHCIPMRSCTALQWSPDRKWSRTANGLRGRLRFRIIYGLIWASLPVWGSFAALCTFSVSEHEQWHDVVMLDFIWDKIYKWNRKRNIDNGSNRLSLSMLIPENYLWYDIAMIITAYHKTNSGYSNQHRKRKWLLSISLPFSYHFLLSFLFSTYFIISYLKSIMHADVTLL